jgi:hypothetical protein
VKVASYFNLGGRKTLSILGGRKTLSILGGRKTLSILGGRKTLSILGGRKTADIAGDLEKVGCIRDDRTDPARRHPMRCSNLP